MNLIADLLERAKASSNIESDYRLAKVLSVNQSVFGHYKAGRSLPNDKILAQLCALSGDDPHLMMARVQAERASSTEAKTLWTTLVKRLSGGASTAILSAVFAISLLAGYAGEARASAVQSFKTAELSSLYIVSSTIKEDFKLTRFLWAGAHGQRLK